MDRYKQLASVGYAPKRKSMDGFVIYPGNKVWVITTRKIHTDQGPKEFYYPISANATKGFLLTNPNTRLFQFRDLAIRWCQENNPIINE